MPKKPRRPNNTLLLFLVLLTGLCLGELTALAVGCRAGSQGLAEPVRMRVIATKDFGRELIFDRTVTVEKRLTAQTLLGRVTDFEMDGSYIVEFEGLRGNDRVYWLYYVNGFMSNVFASGYNMRPGDVMQWDFHHWAGTRHGGSAIIGSFPEPFLHGFGGKVSHTIIAYGEGFSAEAEALFDRLGALGVQGISLAHMAELTDRERSESNLILIGLPQEEAMAQLNGAHVPLGLYVWFEEGRMIGGNWKFEPITEFPPGAGVIQATQNYWNKHGIGACENAIFMVSGTDATGVQNAARALIGCADAILAGGNSAIQNAFGAVITPEGEVIRTPLW
jgi:hypothetical protein